MPRSSGRTRADSLYDHAKALKEQAVEAGRPEIAQIADDAMTAAFNSRSGYEAGSMFGGGSSKGWYFRTRGARWAQKAAKKIDQVMGALSQAPA